jgi:hypothetical protein
MPDLPATLPALEGFEEHNGIRISSFGWDGDLIALGHHDPAVTAGAMTAHADAQSGDHPAITPAGVKPGHAVHWNGHLDDWNLIIGDRPEPGSFPIMHWTAS